MQSLPGDLPVSHQQRLALQLGLEKAQEAVEIREVDDDGPGTPALVAEGELVQLVVLGQGDRGGCALAQGIPPSCITREKSMHGNKLLRGVTLCRALSSAGEKSRMPGGGEKAKTAGAAGRRLEGRRDQRSHCRLLFTRCAAQSPSRAAPCSAQFVASAIAQGLPSSRPTGRRNLPGLWIAESVPPNVRHPEFAVVKDEERTGDRMAVERDGLVGRGEHQSSMLSWGAERLHEKQCIHRFFLCSRALVGRRGQVSYCSMFFNVPYAAVATQHPRANQLRYSNRQGLSRCTETQSQFACLVTCGALSYPATPFGVHSAHSESARREYECGDLEDGG